MDKKGFFVKSTGGVIRLNPSNPKIDVGYAK